MAQDAQASSYAPLRSVFYPSVSGQDSSLWLGRVSLQVKIKSSRPRLYCCGLLRSCQCHAWARWTWHPHRLYGAICEVRCLVHCHPVCPKKPTPFIPPFSHFLERTWARSHYLFHEIECKACKACKSRACTEDLAPHRVQLRTCQGTLSWEDS